VQALKSQYNSLRTPRQLVGGLMLYFAVVNSWGFLHHAFSMAPNLSNPTIMLKVGISFVEQSKSLHFSFHAFFANLHNVLP